MFCFACLHTRTSATSPNMHINTCNDCPLIVNVSLSDTREPPQCSLVWSCFVFPPVPINKGLGLTFRSHCATCVCTVVLAECYSAQFSPTRQPCRNNCTLQIRNFIDSREASITSLTRVMKTLADFCAT